MADQFTPAPRPAHRGPEVIDAAAWALLPAVREWCDDDDTSDASLHKLLVRALRFNADGYDIAREFEREGFSPDAQLVEILDSASSHIWDAHTEAQKAWVKQNNIAAPFPLGTQVKGPDLEGRITRIEADVGRYVVSRSTDEDGYGRILNYEDVTPASKTEAR